MVTITVGLVAYDLLPVTSEQDGDTISEILRTWGMAWPAIPYAWGALAGHFWSPLKRRSSLWVGLVALVAVGFPINLVSWPSPLIPLVAGAIAGATIWPVND